MGEKDGLTQSTGESRRVFMRHLLNDLRALEAMLQGGMIESGVRRVGAEQELFLADNNWRPAAAALQVLEKLDDPLFTTELGLFNLELNLEPGLFGASCLSDMEAQLDTKLRRLQEACEECGVHPVLTGILPTIRLSDLGLENMTPMPRYHALNRAMNEMRGGAYEFHIKGLDELLIKHDSVMVESCNASFQVHFQVGHEESANLYNVAQVVAAPVLAAASNSPMLFGRQLWRETRIALFQQAVDTRSAIHHLRDRSPRVTFGSDWVRDSVTEIFQEDIARFRTLVARDVGEDSLATLRSGGVPSLEALRLHNGTVYRWNRACYGITDGKPHLRIENRVLPSGPTVLDEVANATFWFSLMIALSHKYGDIRQMMDFEDAKMNFTSAARLGLGAQMTWFQGETVSATSLICDRLLPMAEEALLQRGVDEKDVRRYLKVIDQRVNSHRTGSQWMLHSMSVMRGQGTSSERLNALVAGMVRRQFDGTPVHEWKPARLKEAGGWKHNFLKVEQYMTTDLYTVQQDEPVQLVASLMEWNRIRHVPVEDKEHNLVGLISYRQLLKYLARGAENQSEGASAADIMVPGPHTIDPGASTLEAIAMMRQHGIGCLPVVKEGRLVGVITEHDFMNVSAELLEQKLKE